MTEVMAVSTKRKPTDKIQNKLRELHIRVDPIAPDPIVRDEFINEIAWNSRLGQLLLCVIYYHLYFNQCFFDPFQYDISLCKF